MVTATADAPYKIPTDIYLVAPDYSENWLWYTWGIVSLGLTFSVIFSENLIKDFRYKVPIEFLNIFKKKHFHTKYNPGLIFMISYNISSIATKTGYWRLRETDQWYAAPKKYLRYFKNVVDFVGLEILWLFPIQNKKRSERYRTKMKITFLAYHPITVSL